MLALVLFSPALAAAGEDAVWTTFFGRLDGNGDGALTEDEYRRVGEADTFEQLDRDKDAAISPAELQGWIRLTPPRPSDVVPALEGERAAGAGPGGGPATGFGAAKQAHPGEQAGHGAPSLRGGGAEEQGFFAGLRARFDSRLLPFALLVAALLGVLLAEVGRAAGRRRAGRGAGGEGR